MSAPINDGGPAFPWEDIKHTTGEPNPSSGMTLRDWFAGKALPAVIAGMQSGEIGRHPVAGIGASGFAASAYDIADAMLAARKKVGFSC